MLGAAETAAYSAIIAYNKADGTSTVTQAKAVTAAQGYVDGVNGATVTVHRPPSSGNYTSNNSAIEVIISQPQPRFLAGLFLASNPTVAARAVAALIPGTGSGCVIALDASSSGSIAVSGSGNLTTTLCDVVANSTSSSAITVSGSAQISTPCAVAGGASPGVSLGGAATLTLTKCVTPTLGTTVADPYALVPTPAHGSTQTNVCASGSGTLSPGYYATGISIGGSNTCTFSAGVYYVNGNFSIGGSATVTGTGVSIFVAAPGAVSIGGSARVTFSAPTTGTDAGIVFFGDRTGTTSITNTFGGSANSNITGAIYFPTESVNYGGSAGGGSTCTQLVADKITVTGSANFSDSHCNGTGVSQAPAHDGSPALLQVVE
jgi:hypothetical protein